MEDAPLLPQNNVRPETPATLVGGVPRYRVPAAIFVGGLLGYAALTRGSVASQRSSLVSGDQPSNATSFGPQAEKSAAAMTLLNQLTMLGSEAYVAFGHQYDNWYGQNFWEPHHEFWRSDVENATGDYPIVFGYYLQDYMDGRNYSKHMQWAYSRGGIITVDWPGHNPVDNGAETDMGMCDEGVEPLGEILPGGPANELWLEYLNTISAHLKTLTDEEGQTIPVIFRLFREGNEGWYWWGTDCNGDDNFIKAWNYTTHHLRDVLGNNNVLFMYAPSKPSDNVTRTLDTRYPGDELVDILGFDRYAKV